MSLSRSAFSPREAARAGDLWRLFQDIAVEGSVLAGWPPARYLEEGVSFVVRGMTVRHHREAGYGERLTGRTWPSRFRRGMLFRRECRVVAPDGPVASATQEWVHVTSDLKMSPAGQGLVESFPVETYDGPITLPAYEPVRGARTHRFELSCWHTWMDPLGHVNHPTYIDWCDEALSRAMASAGLDPVRLSPVAEEATFKRGVVAGQHVEIETRLVGHCAGAAAFEHRIFEHFERTAGTSDRPCARVISVRRLAGEVGETALLALG